MTSSGKPYHRQVRLAAGAVLLLWLGYIALQTLSVLGRVSDALSAPLSLIPGVLAVGVLMSAGLSFEDCYLRYGRLSARGLSVLVAVFVLALGAMLPVMEWQGWSWLAALVYAPMSGVSQELFFRSALLPVLERLMGKEPTPGKRPRLPLVVHALLFGLWHIGPLFLGAPIWAVLLVMFVPFVSGLGWGWQVQRDRTILWAMIQHSLIWVIGLQFAVPA